MVRDGTIKLIGSTITIDENGVQQEVETERTVNATVSSINQNEWFNGGRNGLNPQLQFLIRDFEYEDEEVLEYNSKRYRIYRTYGRDDDRIELYTEIRKGA